MKTLGAILLIVAAVYVTARVFTYRGERIRGLDYEACPRCKGEGKITADDLSRVDCPRCGGTGER